MRGRLENIDLLRAMAVASVLAYHFTSCVTPLYPEIRPSYTFPLGFLGVDLFFVVSGYCIFMTLERARDVRWFWAKRFARLQPVYMAGAFLTFVVVAIFGIPRHEVSVVEALGNLVWLTLNPLWPLIDGAYWTLLVEIKFYFWIGLIYAQCGGRNISTAWAAFCVLGLISQHIPGANYSNVLFFPNYSPSLLVGIIAYEASRVDGIDRIKTAALLCVAGLLQYLTDHYDQTGIWLIVVTGFGFCVLQLPHLRLPRPIVYLGLISYPVYIVHQYIGYIIMNLAPGPVGFRVALAVGNALLLGVVLHWALDTRFQKPLADFAYRLIKQRRPSREPAPAG